VRGTTGWSEFAPAIAMGQEAIDEFPSLVLGVERPRLDLALGAAVEGLDGPALLVCQANVAPCESAPSAVPPPLDKIRHAL